MSAAWASVLVAFAVAIGVLAGRIWAAGRREGKVDQLLDDVVQLLGDHEDRLRLLEHRPARRRRG